MFRWDETFIDDVHLAKNKSLKGRTIAEIAKEQGKHPIDTLLDLSVEEDLKTEFAMQGFINNNEEAVTTILKHPLCLIGASDGGAHTKFLTLGRYPTHFLAHWVRDKQIMTLEEAHWRLSTMLGWAIGIRDRGWLREGMPADIVVYELEKLAVRPMETIHDLPDGDWRRVQKADGYSYHDREWPGYLRRREVHRRVTGQDAAQLRHGGISPRQRGFSALLTDAGAGWNPGALLSNVT